MRLRSIISPPRARASALCSVAFLGAASQAWAQSPGADTAAQPPYNIIFVISDQEADHLLITGNDYELPARAELRRRGIDFRNHYTASAMCTPSRAAFLSGQPPQVNGVFDQMELAYQPSLSPDMPNMGSVLKRLGYTTAYFGKFELNKELLKTNPSVDYRSALESYGFDFFNFDGDKYGQPNQGYHVDRYFSGEAVRWLRTNAHALNRKGRPFFLVASFLNPHDIMYADANIPGKPAVQKALTDSLLTPPPKDTIYQKVWTFASPPGLQESLTAPGMPQALAEYQTGWSGSFGYIPTVRPDMWSYFYNYYLNLIRDNDQGLQLLLNAMDQLGLWKNTVVVVTADHGEMAGSHGGLRGKGPFAYELNSHVPLWIVHPAYEGGKTSIALTSHIDLLPTFVGMTGLPEAQRAAVVKGLPGHDFSALLANAQSADLHANRPGVLFNYVGLQTIDGNYLLAANKDVFHGERLPLLSEMHPDLNKRGFMCFAFDGRYKFARYYAPAAFNTPQTLDQIFQYNDVQLFDLKQDPQELHNLALDREKNKDLILRMNTLLNELITKEVGEHDNGSFLPAAVRPDHSVVFDRQ
jgi:arylsulfatase A-like enzyme